MSRIAKLLDYAKTRPFNSYEHGYHSITVAGEVFKGQRDCDQRIQPILQELEGKSVVDFGCNVGGMLHALAPNISHGVGFDYNSKCINVANAINTANKSPLEFFVFDFDKEDLSMIQAFLSHPVDVCMMLSIAKWVKHWKELVHVCLSLSNTLLFETNGYNQTEQIDFLKSLYSDVKIISKRSLDDAGQHNRILLLCKK